MDIHAPHGHIQSIKQFLLHMLTIVLGILIAVQAEKWREHREHERSAQEAGVNLGKEMASNQKEIKSALDRIGETRADMTAIRAYVLGGAKPASFDVHFHGAEVGSSAWSTAEAKGALFHMEFGEVQKYAKVLDLQRIYLRMQEQVLESVLELRVYSKDSGVELDKMSASQREAWAQAVARGLSRLHGMAEFAKILAAKYQEP